MKPWTPWTIVHRATGQPVLPMDCAESGEAADEALLVFRSRAAAVRGCKHQKNWQVDAVPKQLSLVIRAEARGQMLPTEDPLRSGLRNSLYEAQGIKRVAGKVAADKRIPHLLKCPAAVRFLSVEPMLGPVDLTEVLTRPPSVGVNILARHYRSADGTPRGFDPEGNGKTYDREVIDPLPLHWVICGGESGKGARAFDVAWARSLREQCKAAGVPFFMKQLGAVHVDGEYFDRPRSDKKGGDMSEWPEDLRVREMPEAAIGGTR